MNILDTLFLITARRDSKGLPNKNVKILNGKPLVAYTIEFAKNNIGDLDEICISTDDNRVIEIATNYNIDVPFIRPSELSNDTATSSQVIKHAIDFYKKRNKYFNKILLLQPTSPIRLDSDFNNIKKTFDSSDVDMVVSVKDSKANPYLNIFIENKSGYLGKIINEVEYSRRQDSPSVYVYNGSMYLFKTESFLNNNDHLNFNKIIKYLMPESRSVDIDNHADWILAEYYLNEINFDER